jgi:integrase
VPNGQPLDPRNFLRHFHELCDRAGVPRRRFHALRHGAATMMLAEGVPLEVISRILGHGGIQITSDVYAHVQRHAHDQAAAAVDRALRGDQSDNTAYSTASDQSPATTLGRTESPAQGVPSR